VQYSIVIVGFMAIALHETNSGSEGVEASVRVRQLDRDTRFRQLRLS
jgi:hypothetical protein